MMSKSEAAYEILSTESPQSDIENGTETASWQQRLSDLSHCMENSSSWKIWIAHILLISLYSTIVLAVLIRHEYLKRQKCASNTDETAYVSPAAQAVGFHSKTLPYISIPGSKYVGNPTPELDRAWKDLFRGYNIRISEDTLTKLNRTSIKLADESGDYWGSLEVFHHLHCLKTIRQYLAIDYYGEENVRHDKPEGNVYPTHIEHCIERLREYLMCVPDLTIFTYDWLEGRDEGPMPNHAVKHTCVDWNQLEDWVDAHRFSYEDALIRNTDGMIWPASANKEQARQNLKV